LFEPPRLVPCGRRHAKQVRPAIAALTSFIPVHQFLFDSDFPYRSLGETADTMPQLGLSEADLTAIGRDNALALLPRLKRD
jgi:6-methylsalicylate decarboxylase